MNRPSLSLSSDPAVRRLQTAAGWSVAAFVGAWLLCGSFWRAVLFGLGAVGLQWLSGMGAPGARASTDAADADGPDATEVAEGAAPPAKATKTHSAKGATEDDMGLWRAGAAFLQATKRSDLTPPSVSTTISWTRLRGALPLESYTRLIRLITLCAPRETLVRDRTLSESDPFYTLRVLSERLDIMRPAGAPMQSLTRARHDWGAIQALAERLEASDTYGPMARAALEAFVADPVVGHLTMFDVAGFLGALRNLQDEEEVSATAASWLSARVPSEAETSEEPNVVTVAPPQPAVLLVAEQDHDADGRVDTRPLDAARAGAGTLPAP